RHCREADCACATRAASCGGATTPAPRREQTLDRPRPSRFAAYFGPRNASSGGLPCCVRTTWGKFPPPWDSTGLDRREGNASLSSLIFGTNAPTGLQHVGLIGPGREFQRGEHD